MVSMKKIIFMIWPLIPEIQGLSILRIIELWVYRTTDAGVTWKKVSSGLVHQDIRDMQVNPMNGRVYAGIWDGYGFAYSDNGGSSWTNNSWFERCRSLCL